MEQHQVAIRNTQNLQMKDPKPTSIPNLSLYLRHSTLDQRVAIPKRRTKSLAPTPLDGIPILAFSSPSKDAQLAEMGGMALYTPEIITTINALSRIVDPLPESYAQVLTALPIPPE